MDAEPLFTIFEKLCLSGKVPCDWRKGNITLPKKGRKEALRNYRPASLTSLLGKII